MTTLSTAQPPDIPESSTAQSMPAAAVASMLLLTACAGSAALKPSSWHLPWRKAPVVAPEPVVELPVQSDSGAPSTVLQYWTRNTLREEYPAMQRMYELYDKAAEVETIQIDAPHNYNAASREAMYRFFAEYTNQR